MAACNTSEGATKPRDVLMVRLVEGEATMKLSFKFSFPRIKTVQFNFERYQDETLGKVLERITCTVKKKVAKKLKKISQQDAKKSRQQQQSSSAGASAEDDGATLSVETPTFEFKAVALLRDEQQLPDDTLLRDAFTDGAELHFNRASFLILTNPPTADDTCIDGAELHFNRASFLIRTNQPCLLGATLPKLLMTGFPVVPRFVLEKCTREDVKVTWFRVSYNDEQTQLAVAATYTPTTSDVDERLKIVCTLVSDESGDAVVAISSRPVEHGPGECAFDGRHPFTAERTSPRKLVACECSPVEGSKKYEMNSKLRIVSYNIFADLYANEAHSRDTLFSTCSSFTLAFDFRQQLLRKEILGYNADIICLQEVDSKVFNGDLGLALKNSGMEGILGLKGGKVAEGVACFFSTARFSLMSQQTLVLADVLHKEPIMEDLYDALCANTKLKDQVMKQTTVIQVVMLRCNDNPRRKLCVVNTQLSYRTNAEYIRLLQAACCMRLIEQVVSYENAKAPRCSVAVIICGDFNSTPTHGVYQFMTERCIPSDHEDWTLVNLPIYEAAFKGIELWQPFRMLSACGTPEYTNYSTEFQGCLDYIFVDEDNFAVEEVVPLPSHEEVTHYITLPSISIPSDHLALVCTLVLI